jgi:hypothetical protein
LREEALGGVAVKEEILAYRLQVSGYELTVECIEHEWKGCVRVGSQKILARITRQQTLAEAQKETCRLAQLEARLQGSVFDACAGAKWEPLTR